MALTHKHRLDVTEGLNEGSLVAKYPQALTYTILNKHHMMGNNSLMNKRAIALFFADVSWKM